MISSLTDLEALLGQYDPGTVLIGPLLNHSINPGFRFFYIAGNGSKIYESVALGLDAQVQRADIVAELGGRFGQVTIFGSHLEMAHAAHTLWPNEETTRFLACAARETKRHPMKAITRDEIFDNGIVANTGTVGETLASSLSSASIIYWLSAVCGVAALVAGVIAGVGMGWIANKVAPPHIAAQLIAHNGDIDRSQTTAVTNSISPNQEANDARAARQTESGLAIAPPLSKAPEVAPPQAPAADDESASEPAKVPAAADAASASGLQAPLSQIASSNRAAAEEPTSEPPQTAHDQAETPSASVPQSPQSVTSAQAPAADDEPASEPAQVPATADAASASGLQAPLSQIASSNRAAAEEPTSEPPQAAHDQAETPSASVPQSPQSVTSAQVPAADDEPASEPAKVPAAADAA